MPKYRNSVQYHDPHKFENLYNKKYAIPKKKEGDFIKPYFNRVTPFPPKVSDNYGY